MSINIKGVCVCRVGLHRHYWILKKEKKHKIQSFELLKVSNLLNLFNF